MKYIAFLLVFIFPIALSAQTLSEADFAQKFRMANVYEGMHDLANAERLYEELYKAQPENQEVADGYVRTLFMLKRFAEVNDVLTQLLKSSPPNQFDLYLLLARTRARLNLKSEALDAFTRAESASPQEDAFGVVKAIADVMVEVGYDEEALTLLTAHRKKTDQPQNFTPEIAKILFKLGHYDEGAKEYLMMLHENDQNLQYVEGRIAQFTADTTFQRTIIQTVIAQIDQNSASLAELRLLGWCYGEIKDYANALNVILIIDGKTSINDKSIVGAELLHFGDRALSEGAFETAIKAYDESLKRFSPNDPRGSSFTFFAQLGSLKARQAILTKQRTPPSGEVRDLIGRYKSFASSQVPIDVAISSLAQAGDLVFKILHDPAEASSIYETIIKKSPSFGDQTRNAYFTLEEIALAQGDIPRASTYLTQVNLILDRRNRNEDAETRRRVLLERARLEYFDGQFDSALVKLSTVMSAPSSDYANDAIALQTLISENLNGSSPQAMKVFSRAELLALGSDQDGALTLYLSIKQTYPKAEIADEATLRAADLMVTMGKWNEALTLLDEMQAQMAESPLLDRAALREAQINDEQLVQKDKALKLYEDFLARFPKSPYTTVVRQRARTLRGDTF